MAKRESGIGTEIKWLEDKQLFCQRFGYKDKTGRNKVKAIYGKSKGEITEKRKAWQKELEAGIDMDTAKMTFGDWLDRWIEVYKRGSIEITTVELYQRIIRLHIKPHAIGSLKLKDINKTKLQAFINEKSKDLLGTTLQSVRAVISNSLRMAVEDDILLKNPAQGVKLPRKGIDEKENAMPFTKDELRAILQTMKPKYYNVVYLAAYTGMRRGEVIGLRWKDVDFGKGVINVRQQMKLIQSTGENISGKLKTSNAYRSIPIGKEVTAALKKQSAWQAANKLSLGTSYIETGLVFTEPTGEAIKGANVSANFGHALKRVDIEHGSFHHLRHTFASIAIANVPNIKAISMMLGHATIRETLDTYGHLLPGDSQTVTAAVEAYLAGL